MATTIAGHKLTPQQRAVLDALLDYLRAWGGDSHMGPNTSPKGDGRWVPLTEIFPARNNQDNGKRRIASRLAALGVLKACEIDFQGNCVKGVPMKELWGVK